jgi:hypothetical protein
MWIREDHFFSLFSPRANKKPPMYSTPVFFGRRLKKGVSPEKFSL